MTPLAERFARVLGPRGIVADPADMAPYLRDWRGLRDGASPVVLRPATVEEAAEAVKIAAAEGLAIVPQGGNTSLVAGAVPDGSGRQIVLSLARLNRIRAVDPIDRTMIAEAGVTLKAAQDAATENGCLFPLSLAAEGSATIGGALATNAGGNTTIRYGNARDLMLGLEAILPDGRIWHGLRRLRKDNTGYALRHLFAGSEGTLGLITAASLRLFPVAVDRAVAFCALRDEDAALALYRRFDARDARLRAFEYMSDRAIALVQEFVPGVTLPVSPAKHYALIDLSSSDPAAGLREIAESALGEALETGEVLDAAIAESTAQETALWRIREELSEAQRKAGLSIKNDISVPVSAVPEFLRAATAACERLLPGIRVAPFGHLGDGNIHFNLVQPEGDAAALDAKSDALIAAVNEIVRRLDGSFSAEHGIGALKLEQLRDWRGGVEYELFRAIKKAFDPSCRFNPGKLLPESAAS